MARIEEAIFSRLSADSNITAIVGALPNCRIFPVKMPDKTAMPAITYFRVSGPRVESFQGSSTLAHPLFQIDCWAKTFQAADNLASKVRNSLQGYAGTTASVRIQGILLENDLDLYEEDTETYHRVMDFRIWYDEQ